MNEISSIMKLKKKNEIDMLVRRGNIFNEQLKEALKNKKLDKSLKLRIQKF